MSDIKFKDEFPFEKRREEADRIISKYPDRVPVIVELEESSGWFSSKTEPLNLDKKKYLVPKDITMGQFMIIIRKRVKIEEHEGLFTFVGNQIIPTLTTTMGEIYENYKDLDQYLYVSLARENTFG